MRSFAAFSLWIFGFFVGLVMLLVSFVTVECASTPITGVGFSQDGSPILTRIDGQVERWGGVLDRATYFYANAHTSFIDGIAYSPDGKILASASEDHTVKLWDGADGHYLATLAGNSAQTTVAFSPLGGLDRLARPCIRWFIKLLGNAALFSKLCCISFANH